MEMSCRHVDEIFVTAHTESCQNDRLQVQSVTKTLPSSPFDLWKMHCSTVVKHELTMYWLFRIARDKLCERFSANAFFQHNEDIFDSQHVMFFNV